MTRSKRTAKQVITFNYMNAAMASDLMDAALARARQIVSRCTDDTRMIKALCSLSVAVWAKLAHSICLEGIRHEKNAKIQLMMINDFRQLIDAHRPRDPQYVRIGSSYGIAYMTLCVFIDEYPHYQRTQAISEDFWMYASLNDEQRSMFTEHAATVLVDVRNITMTLIDEMTTALEARLYVFAPELKSPDLSDKHAMEPQTPRRARNLRFSENNSVYVYVTDDSENTRPPNQSHTEEHTGLSLPSRMSLLTQEVRTPIQEEEAISFITAANVK